MFPQSTFVGPEPIVESGPGLSEKPDASRPGPAEYEAPELAAMILLTVKHDGENLGVLLGLAIRDL
jgi:hypothetical protein